MQITKQLDWKLRRIAAGLRQQDIAARIGVSSSRYSAIERGELSPSQTDCELIEQLLPQIKDLRPTKQDAKCENAREDGRA